MNFRNRYTIYALAFSLITLLLFLGTLIFTLLSYEESNSPPESIFTAGEAPSISIINRLIKLHAEPSSLKLRHPDNLCDAILPKFYIEQMTDEEKLNQLLVPIISGIQLQSFESPTVPFGGYVVVDTYSTFSNAESFKADVARLHNLETPTFVGIDSEGGVVKRLSWYEIATLSSIKDSSPEIFCDRVQQDAAEIKSLGFNWMISPVLDVPSDSNDWISNRTIDLDPHVVSSVGSQYLNCIDETRMISTPKHFPGHGNTLTDSHKEIPVIEISKDVWDSASAIPFAMAVQEDAPMIMVGHLQYVSISDQVSSTSPYWIQTVLKESMGYQGVVVTDDISMLRPKTSSECATNINNAFAAGNDLVMFADRGNCRASEITPMISVESEQIDQRLEKILTLKQEYLCRE